MRVRIVARKECSREIVGDETVVGGDSDGA